MESRLNTTTQNLESATSFVGKNEIVNGYLYIICNLKTTKDCVITSEQSTNGTEYQFSEQFAHIVSVFGEESRTQFAVKAYWVRITVFNATLDDIPKMVLTTLFSAQTRDTSLEQPQNIVGDIVVTNPMKARDYASNAVREVACDDQGVLKTATSITNIQLTPSNDGISVYGSSDGTDRLILATTDAGILKTDTNVTIENIELTPANDGVMIYASNDGTTPLVIKTDDTGKLDVILDQTKVGETGNDFLFIPTADNNTVAIYADGAAGTTIPNIGWRYTNDPAAALKKINWYVYQSPLIETSYKVSELKNIYTVINNITTSNKLPFFAFYTRITGSGDASWYKSRLVFSASNTTGTGVKFLYTGEDPVHIHPEITGANRIQLVLDPISSTKTIELAKDEIIFTSTLQTDSGTSVAGSFDFVFQDYGIVWEKTKVFLPVEFGKLQIKGDVSVSNFPATQAVSGTIAVSNFPTPVTSVAVNNLEPIETKLDENNVLLGNISGNQLNTLLATTAIKNSLNYPARQQTIVSPPEPLFLAAGQVVTSSQFPLESVQADAKYRNVIYMGSVDASVNTNPKLVFQYSDDDTNWFSDGVSSSFYKPVGSTTWQFAFQRSGLGVKSVRLVAQTSTTIGYLAINLSV